LLAAKADFSPDAVAQTGRKCAPVAQSGQGEEGAGFLKSEASKGETLIAPTLFTNAFGLVVVLGELL
jgi:hypothetical protein